MIALALAALAITTLRGAGGGEGFVCLPSFLALCLTLSLVLEHTANFHAVSLLTDEVDYV